MRVLLIGASSQLGHYLLPRLLDRGDEVFALSRRERPARTRLHWLQGHLPASLPALPAVDTVISFGPLDQLAVWLERAELAAGTVVVATGSMSADSKNASPVAAERELSVRLRRAEQGLLARGARYGWRCTVLRPTLIWGAGMDRSLSPLAQRARRQRLFPLPKGPGLRQPVHAEDVALAALAASERPQAAGHVIPVGGGERLSVSAMFARVRGSLGCWTLPVPLWRWPLRMGSLALPRLRGPVARLGVDLIADNALLQSLLAIEPRGFHPCAGDWSPRDQDGCCTGKDAAGAPNA